MIISGQRVTGNIEEESQPFSAYMPSPGYQMEMPQDFRSEEHLHRDSDSKKLTCQGDMSWPDSDPLKTHFHYSVFFFWVFVSLDKTNHCLSSSFISLHSTSKEVYYYFNPPIVGYLIPCDSRHVEIIVHQLAERLNILTCSVSVKLMSRHTYYHAQMMKNDANKKGLSRQDQREERAKSEFSRGGSRLGVSPFGPGSGPGGLQPLSQGLGGPPTIVQEAEGPPPIVPEVGGPPPIVPEFGGPPSIIPEVGGPPAAVPEARAPPTIVQEANVPPSVIQEADVPPTIIQEAGVPPTVVQEAGGLAPIIPEAGRPPSIIVPEAGGPLLVVVPEAGRPQPVVPVVGGPPPVIPEVGGPPTAITEVEGPPTTVPEARGPPTTIPEAGGLQPLSKRLACLKPTLFQRPESLWPSLLQRPETESYMPILCSPIPSPSSSSVHALRPFDISGVYTLGKPLSHSALHSGLMFCRSLLEEAEELSHFLSPQVTDWKFVLLFSPADAICACSPHVSIDLKAVVEKVEAALQMLQKRLVRTLVHVVVWSGYHHQQDRCECKSDKNINQGLYKAILLKALQDSLSHAFSSPEWHNEGTDFTVVLQPTPLVLEPSSDPLQPSVGQAKVVDSFPCPTEERPFLRTQINSPSEAVGKSHSKSTALTDAFMGTEVPCTDRSPSDTTPVSVHELRPADIKVVAALGDSLTAANGVGAEGNNILLLLNEYRGLSWSIGGDENITTVTTLANILKEFNSNLTGFSTGIGSEDSEEAYLNVAVPGAKSEDMVRQVGVLVDKMKNDSRIDFHNDWKVITMFIGGNDICDFCTNTIVFSPSNVAGRIRDALDILHREVPRAIVNLIEMLHIVPLREVHQDTSVNCPTWFVKLICPCVLNAKNGSLELQKLIDFNRGYQLAMRELIDTGRYDKHDNFTVILQPFLREIFLPRLENGQPDRSYFAPDCFHLSQKAHTLMARALWNNMLEPVGNKTFTQDFTAGMDLKCPSETNPFFMTAFSSNYTYPGPPPTAAPNSNWGSTFSCADTAPSNSVPSSVHMLRPADIKVVAALGDSLTTGFGAKANNIILLPFEYRGVSWSIGGDGTLETVTTLPNILKKFNPAIKGVSLGIGTSNTGFNVAVSGAKISGIPGQVRNLINAMKEDPTVDFQNDWKLVTLFIGGNDLCQYCNDRATYSPQNYTYHMMTSLDMLYSEVPRMFVNVVEILEIEGLRRIKRDSIGCSLIQPFVCPCFLQPGEDSPELAEVKRINREMQDETEKLVHGGRYDGREDFAVVVQPFFKNVIVPLNATGNPDVTYFSEDCFHFSERGHADMAAALWNNMLEPVGEKQTYNDFENIRNNLKCPAEDHPYIFTKVNSLPISTTNEPTPDGTAPPLTPTKTPDCPENIQVWLAPVMAVVGLLVGGVVTWLFTSYRAKKSKRKMAATGQMKATTF
ncbi:phospholipase B1, membrane-associated [Pholidichthys leucotaenia]